ncbi:tankyrase-2-like [Trichogramma pretiosum]|uniref:tankyrase-2-like n=1 Tax=Trichogramma pretiosum TaxID=7493 RepID=UPI000C71C2C4|nr:tankyrase-2-like [Trichogramma pretiosum]
MAQENQDSLSALKRMRENVNWEMENERRKFYWKFCSLITNWQGPLPNLRDIFLPDEIDWLLAEPFKSYGGDQKTLVDFVINTGYKDEDCKHLLLRTTPIHCSAKRWFPGKDIVVGKLFKIYDSFDVNYVDEDGLTHFHMACKHGCVDVVKKFLELGQDINCIAPETGDSPLHLALENYKTEVAKLLLRNGASLTLANKDGSTPLHLIFKIDADGGLTEMFFEICRDRRQTIQVDARDKEGNTPLYLALSYDRKKAVETLLRNGANPNLVNDKGKTPLHIMCRGWIHEDLVKMFLDISDTLNRPVQVDARDNEGNTPLHFALLNCRLDVPKLLLKHRADPNAANQEGSTPLHLICKNVQSGPKLLRIFFKTCDEVQQTVQVDARDKLGQTPLQLAVTHLSLDAVDVLLDRGADLFEFSFPTKSLFKHVYGIGYDCSKLQLVSNVLRVVEHLKDKGYELDRNDVLTIVSSFSEYGLFEKSVDLDKSWYDDVRFAEKAKNIMIIKPDLSLYDLTRLRPIETKKLLAKKEYIKFACTKKLNKLLTRHRRPCALYLCEKISREFFRRWALDAFLELTNYQLHKDSEIKSEMDCENEKPVRGRKAQKKLYDV